MTLSHPFHIQNPSKHGGGSPISKALSVACLYCEDFEAKMLVDICRVPMPVFWGQGGGEKSLGVMEFARGIRGVSVLHKQVIHEISRCWLIFFWGGYDYYDVGAN